MCGATFRCIMFRNQTLLLYQTPLADSIYYLFSSESRDNKAFSIIR